MLKVIVRYASNRSVNVKEALITLIKCLRIANRILTQQRWLEIKPEIPDTVNIIFIMLTCHLHAMDAFVQVDGALLCDHLVGDRFLVLTSPWGSHSAIMPYIIININDNCTIDYRCLLELTGTRGGKSVRNETCLLTKHFVNSGNWLYKNIYKTTLYTRSSQLLLFLWLCISSYIHERCKNHLKSRCRWQLLP